MSGVAQTSVHQSNPAAVRPLYLLALLGANKCAPVTGRTRLVKLVFLIQKKIIEELKLAITQDGYRFRALNYGPFSEDVYDDFATLQLRGLAEVDGEEEAVQSYHLTPRGTSLLSKLIQNGVIPAGVFDEIRKLKETYGDMPLNKLIERVYSQYPAYTGRSVIKDRYKY